MFLVLCAQSKRRLELLLQDNPGRLFDWRNFSAGVLPVQITRYANQNDCGTPKSFGGTGDDGVERPGRANEYVDRG